MNGILRSNYDQFVPQVCGSNINEKDAAPEIKRSKLEHRADIVTKSEMITYFKLLESPYIYEFLKSDSCFLYSDKYILSMVFAYFKRAELRVCDYTQLNFFVALYIANEMEEDEECFKYEILPWALGTNWKKKLQRFFKLKDHMFYLMNYRALVSKICCDEVMNLEHHHWAWSRIRQEHHSGALRRVLGNIFSHDYRPKGPYASPLVPCQLCASIGSGIVTSVNNSTMPKISWSNHFRRSKIDGERENLKENNTSLIDGKIKDGQDNDDDESGGDDNDGSGIIDCNGM